MQPIRVIVADYDAAYRAKVVEHLSKQGGINVIGQTANGLETLALLQTQPADVVISSLLLPYFDGFALLEHIAAMNARTRPRTIVLTSLSGSSFVTRAINLGASEYLIKPIDLNVLAGRVRMLQAKPDVCTAAPLPPPAKAGLVRHISSILLGIGIPAHVSGFHFMREAVRLVSSDPALLQGRTKVLYPMVAGLFQTSAVRVERAMRHAITRAWQGGHCAGQAVRLPLPAYKPASGELIAIVAEYVRQRCHTTAS